MRILAQLLALLCLAAPLAAQCQPGPPDIVRQFLQMDEAQAQQFAELLQNRNNALAPLGHQLEQAGPKLSAFLTANPPDPTAVGQQVLVIFSLQRQIQNVLESAQRAFVSLLTAEQREKLAAVQQAAQLMPVVPSFAELRFIAPPGPGPRESAPEPEVIRLPQR